MFILVFILERFIIWDLILLLQIHFGSILDLKIVGRYARLDLHFLFVSQRNGLKKWLALSWKKLRKPGILLAAMRSCCIAAGPQTYFASAFLNCPHSKRSASHQQKWPPAAPPGRLLAQGFSQERTRFARIFFLRIRPPVRPALASVVRSRASPSRRTPTEQARPVALEILASRPAGPSFFFRVLRSTGRRPGKYHFASLARVSRIGWRGRFAPSVSAIYRSDSSLVLT